MSGTNGSWKRVEKLTLRAPGDFRSSGGCRQPEGVRETRVTRPVTEFPDRPLPPPLSPSGDARRGIPFSRSGARDYALKPPLIPRTEKCHWLAEFRVDVLSIDGDHRVRESPAGDAGNGVGNCGYRAKRGQFWKLRKFCISNYSDMLLCNFNNIFLLPLVLEQKN